MVELYEIEKKTVSSVFHRKFQRVGKFRNSKYFAPVTPVAGQRRSAVQLYWSSAVSTETKESSSRAAFNEVRVLNPASVRRAITIIAIRGNE